MRACCPQCLRNRAIGRVDASLHRRFRVRLELSSSDLCRFQYDLSNSWSDSQERRQRRLLTKRRLQIVRLVGGDFRKRKCSGSQPTPKRNQVQIWAEVPEQEVKTLVHQSWSR